MGYGGWNGDAPLGEREFRCGHCGKDVRADHGFSSSTEQIVFICPCRKPTYFFKDIQIPGPLSGEPVRHLPSDIAALYEEVRRCMSVNSFTAAVLACRKLLMNIAVSKGATQGQSFVSYVEYLSEKGYVPPDAKHWVDHIRQKGNEATHEIQLMTREEAERLIGFLAMLMKMVFEFPAALPKPKL